MSEKGETPPDFPLENQSPSLSPSTSFNNFSSYDNKYYPYGNFLTEPILKEPLAEYEEALYTANNDLIKEIKIFLSKHFELKTFQISSLTLSEIQLLHQLPLNFALLFNQLDLETIQNIYNYTDYKVNFSDLELNLLQIEKLEVFKLIIFYQNIDIQAKIKNNSLFIIFDPMKLLIIS